MRMASEAIPPGEGPGYGLLGPRTRHLIALEFGNQAQFDDPALEWRRLFSELLGTFFLLLAAAGGGLLHAKGEITLSAAVVAPGLTVLGIILYMGAVSGAHLNPAVTLAFALRGDFPWKRVPGAADALACRPERQRRAWSSRCPLSVERSILA